MVCSKSIAPMMVPFSQYAITPYHGRATPRKGAPRRVPNSCPSPRLPLREPPGHVRRGYLLDVHAALKAHQTPHGPIRRVMPLDVPPRAHMRRQGSQHTFDGGILPSKAGHPHPTPLGEGGGEAAVVQQGGECVSSRFWDRY